MKSTIENPAENSEVKYPCLMVNVTSGYVVLFTDRSEGTVVSSPLSTYPIGFTSCQWNVEHFKPFHGKVILEN
jgi:hypothetical protein